MDTQNAVVEEVIDNGPSAQDQLDLEAINAIAAEMAPEFDDEPDDEVVDPAEPHPESEAGTEEPAPEAETPVVEERVDPAVEKGFARLVEREVAIQQREAALKAQEQEVHSLRTQLAEAQKVAASIPSDVLAQLNTTPGAALKALGHDPEHVVRLYLAEKLKAEGKQVPAELREQLREAEMNAKMAALEAQQKAFEQKQAAANFIAQVEFGAQQYVTKGDFKDAPAVATVAKANPARVYELILDEIAQDAGSPGKDPRSPVLTPAEAISRIEKRWTEMKALFGGPAPGASTTAVTTPSTKAAPTSKPTVPSKPLNSKDPAKMTQKELEEMAIKEAELEFRRAQKAARVGK